MLNVKLKLSSVGFDFFCFRDTYILDGSFQYLCMLGDWDACLGIGRNQKIHPHGTSMLRR